MKKQIQTRHLDSQTKKEKASEPKGITTNSTQVQHTKYLKPKFRYAVIREAETGGTETIQLFKTRKEANFFMKALQDLWQSEK